MVGFGCFLEEVLFRSGALDVPLEDAQWTRSVLVGGVLVSWWQWFEVMVGVAFGSMLLLVEGLMLSQVVNLLVERSVFLVESWAWGVVLDVAARCLGLVESVVVCGVAAGTVEWLLTAQFTAASSLS